MTDNDQNPNNSSMTDEEALPAVFPTADQVFGIAELERNRHRMKLSCTKLPPNLNDAGDLDSSSPFGTGLGPWLNTAIGGGVHPGFFGLLVATQAKAGKTTFVDQLAMGLTMQGAQHYCKAKAGEPSGPIIKLWILSTMASDQLEDWTISRYIRCPREVLGAGGSAHRLPSVCAIATRAKVSPDTVVSEIFDRAHKAVSDDSLFKFAREFRRRVSDFSLETGVSMLANLESLIACDRAITAQEAGVSPNWVWPVLVVDSIQDFADTGEVDAFVKKLRNMANGFFLDQSDSLVILATSYTCARTSKPKMTTAQALGGSYAMCHLPDAAMLLHTSRDEDERWRSTITVGFSRNAPETATAFPFDYDPVTGRFSALPPNLSFDPADQDRQPSDVLATVQRMNEAKAAKRAARTKPAP